VFRAAEVSDCGQWLIITPQKDCRDNLLLFCDLRTLPNNEISGKVNLTQVVHKFEADYQVMLILYLLKIIEKLIFDI
jgi:prolyl oligopeptidase